MRTIIVVNANAAQKMNKAAERLDPAAADTFTVGLADPSDPTTPVAYWASWDFSATGHDLGQFKQHMVEEGADPTETSEVKKNERNWDSLQEVAVFDAAEWTPEEVLAEMNLVRAEPVEDQP